MCTLKLGMPTLDAKLNTAPAANAPAISSNNFSPIFLQWVDCVAQILRMYPRAFEFSSAYLVEIVDCVFSGRFGNFLCNTEKERLESGVADSCGCMWLYLAQLRSSSHGRSNIHEHCNIFYSPDSPDEHPEPLLPPAAAFSWVYHCLQAARLDHMWSTSICGMWSTTSNRSTICGMWSTTSSGSTICGRRPLLYLNFIYIFNFKELIIIIIV